MKSSRELILGLQRKFDTKSLQSLKEKQDILAEESKRYNDGIDSLIRKVRSGNHSKDTIIMDLVAFKEFHTLLVDRVYADGFSNGVFNAS